MAKLGGGPRGAPRKKGFGVGGGGAFFVGFFFSKKKFRVVRNKKT